LLQVQDQNKPQPASASGLNFDELLKNARQNQQPKEKPMIPSDMNSNVLDQLSEFYDQKPAHKDQKQDKENKVDFDFGLNKQVNQQQAAFDFSNFQ
jgi:hypothetical protein